MLVCALLSCQSFALSLVNEGEECVTRNEVQEICGTTSLLGVHVKIAVGSSYYKHMIPHRDFLIGSLFENVWNKIAQATLFRLRHILSQTHLHPES